MSLAERPVGASIGIVALLITTKAGDIKVLHLGCRIQRQNLVEFHFGYLVVLAVGRLVALHPTPVANNFLLSAQASSKLQNWVGLGMTGLRNHAVVTPVFRRRKVAQRE